MSAKRNERAARPLKRNEFEICFANAEAAKGWMDLLAVARNAMVDAWEHLTRHPLESSARCYPLKAAYATVTIGGQEYEQWQYKVTDGARIWYCLVPSDPKAKPRPKVAGVVHLLLCSPGHPKQTE